MQASDMLNTDGLMLERLGRFRGEQAQGMRGYKSLSYAEKHNHHIFPQAFRTIAKDATKGKFNIDAFTVRMNEVLHLKALHGGGYNKLFKKFLDSNQKKIKSGPMFLVGFGFGLMNEAGFGNFGL